MNGGFAIITHKQQDVAVVLTNAGKGVLYVLNIAPEHRSHRLGSALLHYFDWNFVRAVEEACPWFEQRGYKPVGDWMIGRKLRTRVLVRERLFELAGRLQNIDLVCNRDVGDGPEAGIPAAENGL